MEVAHAFRLQAAACDKMGSRLYARLLVIALEDLEREGPVHRVVSHWGRNPMDDAVPLRLLGGVHRLVLDGAAPELANHYPSVGGAPSWPDCGEAFLATVEANVEALRIGMLHPPQTNEVGRSGVLVGGLLELARMHEMPIRLLEFGTSAGLNLRLDGYAYEFGVAKWGEPTSPVVVRTRWRGSTPGTDRLLHILERRGCDAAPIDVTDAAQAQRLASFVWPDQVERFVRTQRAIDVFRRDPVPLDAADAASWLGLQLADSRSGVVTVVMHSAVRQYLSAEQRRAVDATIQTAADRATSAAPLARLAFEPGPKYFTLSLRMWPQGIDLTLACAHPHGAWAEWYIGSDPA